MKYDELMGIIKEKIEIHTLMKSSISPKIKEIKMVDGALSNWNESTLYVGNTIILDNISPEAIMLCSVNQQKSLPPGSNHTLIPQDQVDTLYYMAKDLIFEDLKAEVGLLELAQSALDGINVSNLINTAAKLLGNGVILTDTNMNILAYSTIYEIKDPLWEQNIKNGYCSNEFKQRVNSCEPMKGWSKQDDSTILIKLPGDLQNKLVSRIIYNNHLVGGITMIEHHTPISRSHIVQLPFIGEILYKMLCNDLTGIVNKSLHSTILYNLLDELDATSKSKSIPKIDLPEVLRVVVARYVYPMYNRHFKRSIIIEFERIFPEGYSVQYKGYMAILVSSISENQRTELEKLKNQYDVSIGISWEFYNIAQFKRYFNQAVSAIKLSQRIGNTIQIDDYTSYAIFDLLNNYSGRIPLQSFCHPVLEILKTYDKINDTEFYTTLRTYLKLNKNLSLTSKALFIHRNSLTYRLGRITQLTGIDLNDVNLMYSLMDSFRIDEFLSSSLN